jgi:tRNA dimethylallyltransferase
MFILTGATGTGKTKLSLEFAYKYSFSIINFDSLSFYKDLTVVTAKPSEEDCLRVHHDLINFLNPYEKCNIFKFLHLVKEVKRKSFFVGGSIFYLQALIKKPYQENPIQENFKSFFERIYEFIDTDTTLSFLSSIDPNFLQKYSKNDHYRIKRAILFFLATNQPYSEQKSSEGEYSQYTIVETVLEKKDHLYFLEKRIDTMIQDGMIEEVADFLKKYPGSVLENTIGVKEVLMYLNKECSLTEMKEMIFIRTRQLAKRQKNFLKKFSTIKINMLTDQDPVKLLETIYPK